MSVVTTRNRPGRLRSTTGRQLSYVDLIFKPNLSAPIFLVGFLLLGSYILRMTVVPWPLPRDLTNYVAISIACIAAFVSSQRLSPIYLLGLFLTLPSVFISPIFEDSGLRWTGWALLIIAVGPIFSGKKCFQFRILIIASFLAFAHLATIGSGLLGLVGIQAAGGRGPYWGLLSHSNILGSVASLAALDSFSKWSSRDQVKAKSFWLIVLLVELMTATRAASRAALLAFAIGSILITAIRDQKTKMHLLLTLLLLITAGVAYFGVQESSRASSTEDTSVLVNLAKKGFRNTREKLWADRIVDFQSSPFIGVGFCMGGVEGMRVQEDGFMQEPGSSYLAALSMTGIFGAMGFLILIGPMVRGTLAMASKKFGSDPPFYVVTAPFWLVAMLTEGFSHYVGNPFCFAIFLWAGVCADSQALFPSKNPLRLPS